LLRPFYVFSVQPTMTQITGNHTMRYGYDYRVLRENFSSNGYQGGRFFFDGTYTTVDLTTTTNSTNQTNTNRNRNVYGRDLAAFLLGIPTAQATQSVIDTTGINYSAQSQYHGFFFQDDWRVTPKLTLNLGLRYELELGLTERYNRFIRGFDLESSSPIETAARAAYTTAYNANPSNFIVAPDAFRVLGGPQYAGENNRALWNADKTNLLPRFGLAYQLNERTVLRGGFGMFSSPFRINPDDLRQVGFNAQTPFIPTNDQGRTFVSTLNNPFPSGFQSAFGSTRGLLTSVGGDLGASDAGLVPADRRNAKFSRVIVGLQRELPGQFVVEANFVSSWGRDLAVNRNLNFVPREFLADLNGVTDFATAQSLDAAANTRLSATVANPFRNLLPNSGSPFNTATTISRAQSALRFPQFANVYVQEYNGTNRYNSLQLQANKRFSTDLSLNVTYTYSKLRERLSYLNPSDAELEDRVGTDDRPNRFTLATVYRLPFGRGRAFGKEMNKVLDAFIGGWQFNGTYEWQQGQPILLSQAFFYAGDINAVESRAGQGTGDGRKYGIDLPVFVTPDGAPFTTTNNTILRLNSTSLRTIPTTMDNLRHMPFQSVQLSLTKNFRMGEGRNLQIRGEALNALNRPYFIDLSADPTNASFGLYSTQRNTPRDIQIGAKFTF
ncbi:MAG TPA: TonB-dependent receptor, partial [Pyrinomonadaceae bacterium]